MLGQIIHLQGSSFKNNNTFGHLHSTIFSILLLSFFSHSFSRSLFLSSLTPLFLLSLLLPGCKTELDPNYSSPLPPQLFDVSHEEENWWGYLVCVNCTHESEEGKNESSKIRCAENGIWMVVILEYEWLWFGDRGKCVFLMKIIFMFAKP